MPSNGPILFLPQDLCLDCSLFWNALPLCFYTTGSCHSGHSPNGTWSERAFLNSQQQPSLAKALSGCLQKHCAALSPSLHIHPHLQAAFLAPRRVTGSPPGEGYPPHSDPRYP